MNQTQIAHIGHPPMNIFKPFAVFENNIFVFVRACIKPPLRPLYSVRPCSPNRLYNHITPRYVLHIVRIYSTFPSAFVVAPLFRLIIPALCGHQTHIRSIVCRILSLPSPSPHIQCVRLDATRATNYYSTCGPSTRLEALRCYARTSGPFR